MARNKRFQMCLGVRKYIANGFEDARLAGLWKEALDQQWASSRCICGAKDGTALDQKTSQTKLVFFRFGLQTQRNAPK